MQMNQLSTLFLDDEHLYVKGRRFLEATLQEEYVGSRIVGEIHVRLQVEINLTNYIIN